MFVEEKYQLLLMNFNSVLMQLPRVNNCVEGFRNALQSSITLMHLNLWKLCLDNRAEGGISQTEKILSFDGDKQKLLPNRILKK